MSPTCWRMTAASAEDFNCFLEIIPSFCFCICGNMLHCLIYLDLCHFDTVTVRNVKHLSQNYEMELKKIKGATNTITGKYTQ